MSALSALRRLSCLGLVAAVVGLAATSVTPVQAQTPGGFVLETNPVLDKQCSTAALQPNGDYDVSCILSLAVEAGNAPIVSDIQYFLQDVLTDAGGTPQPGWITSAPGYFGSSTGCTVMPGNGPGWDCAVPPILWQDTVPNAISVPLALVSMTIPAGTQGPLENCVTLSVSTGFPMPESQLPVEQVSQACADIDLPINPTTPLEPGGQCLAFTPEVTCNPETGTPMVTLSNAYSGYLTPDAVRITSLTPGISVMPGSAPLSVVLFGAAPGDTLTMMTEATQTGAGSAPGLDLCCMGEIEIEIPAGLTCEIPTDLTVEKTCTIGDYPSGANVDCEITVTYDGPPPTTANPLTISDVVSAGPWSVDAFMGSTHNWNCDATPHSGPAPWGCTISDTDEPGADWSDFSSTIVVQMSTDELFENCAAASAASGLEAESCWSNLLPDLEIDKTGPAECNGTDLCDYAITLTAGPNGYTGPVVLADQAPTGFNIVAVAPPISGCTLPANPLACTIPLALGNSASEIYTITIQSDGSTSGPISGDNCAAAFNAPIDTSAGAQPLTDVIGGDAIAFACLPITSINEDCADGEQMVDGVCTPIETETPAYTLAKTCEMGDEAIDCVITLTTNGVPFTGEIVVQDQSNLPAGSATTISAPVGTCSDMTMECSFTAAELAGLTPPNTVQISVTLAADAMVEGFMNCALGSNPQMGSQRDCMINGEFDKPRDPPPPNATCSSDYIFVVDSSGSIGSNAGDVSVAVRNMAQILNGNGSQASLILFNNTASLVQPMSVATLAGMASNYGMLFTPGGSTNWEAALTLAATQAGPNTTIIFITDGRPTAYLDGSGNPVILADGPATWLTATNEAIPVVNQIYSSGVPIIGIGIAGPGEGSFVSTYLDALLGTSTAGTTFAAMNADMTALAYSLCADLHLTKLINGSPFSQVNFHSVVGDSYRMTITLRAQNTTGADLSNVVIEDLLPANLTNPGNILPVGAPVVFTGQNVSWTPALIAAGATETITFQVDLARPAPDITNCTWQTNFAQVQSLTGAIQSTPGNMDPALGPDVEPDEGSARFCAYDQPPNPPADCVEQWLEVQKTVVDEACFVGQPCEFSVNVRPRACHADGFSGDVIFADAVTLQPGGTTIAAPVAAITNTHSTPICAYPTDWSATSLPTGCTTPVTLAQSSSITFNVTIVAPSAGEYTNCFVAEDRNLPTTPTGAMASVSPPTQPTWWQPRGNCVNFTVSQQIGIAPSDEPNGQPRSGEAELTITKTLQDTCRTSQAARQHECDFALVVTNSGTAPFAGPVALSDHITGIVPLSSRVQSVTNWSCDTRGNSASCVNGAVMLQPGQSTGLILTLTLPAGPRAIRLENCAALGVGPGEAERTLLVQRVMQIMGIDGGPVDGISGRQTRAGLRLLSTRLGLTPDETINPALLAALGLANAWAPACASADLPAIRVPTSTPSTPTTPSTALCDGATTVERGNACACRFEGMVRLNARACGCPQGLSLDAARGCVRPGTPTDPGTPVQELRCDPQTTVRVGNSCECRAPGMTRLNATSCGCPSGSQLLGALGCVPIPRLQPRAVP